MQSNDAQHARWLSGFAAHLSARQAAVLASWRAEVDADPELTTSTSLPRAQFNDHIPALLRAFGKRLRVAFLEPEAPVDMPSEDAQAHGLQRWQQGYRLREVTREWGHLQRCLLHELETYASNHDAPLPALQAAYRALVEMCSEGVSDSTAQYFHLEQIEALGQVRDLSQTLNELRALERERGELWRQAAHDLRGNFGVVANVTAGLSLQAVPEATRDRFFKLLQKSVTSVHAMLDDVMALARLQAGQEQRTIAKLDVAPLFRSMCEAFEPLAADRGLFLAARGPDRLDVEGDAIKLRRIAQNLILNALKYTESGGVTVTWEDSRVGDAERWAFAVHDTGPGIHAGPGAPIAEALEAATHESAQVEQRGPAFEPTAEATGAEGSVDARPVTQVRGEGVGLSIVKRLCDLLDASVEVESAAGQGTLFRIVLPKAYPPTAAGAASPDQLA